MIARVDAAAYGVLLLLRVQMIANPGKTRNSHLIDTRNQNQSYGNRRIYTCMTVYTNTCICTMYIYIYFYESESKRVCVVGCWLLYHAEL